MILAGRVSCNGKVSVLGDTADESVDEILLDGKPLPSAGEHIYIMLNKPSGFVTTLSDEKGRKTVAELVKNCNMRVYPVGRLDMNSEGLLLLTNDGDFANKLMHPKHQIEKVYRVKVTGYSPEGIQRLLQPISLDGYAIATPKVELLNEPMPGNKTAELLITIHEGRNRQVRRMCEIAGMKVCRLTRIQEGSLKLGDLPKGKWRYLSQDEVFHLINAKD